MPKRVDHDERRRQIVRALWRIAERGGLGAVSFREVAAEAGVSVRLVQYYFGTKADLLREANRQALQTMGARIARRPGRHGRRPFAPRRSWPPSPASSCRPTTRAAGRCCSTTRSTRRR